MFMVSRSDIEEYKKMEAVPAGAVLRHVLKGLGMSQRYLAKACGMPPQHINAYINGKRRFSVSASIAIESVLGIEEAGFFYRHQAMHDVHVAKVASEPTPDLERLRRATFWDVDLTKVRWKDSIKWAIRRVLEYGTSQEVNEIIRFYGIGDVRDAFRNMSFRKSDVALKMAEEAGI